MTTALATQQPAFTSEQIDVLHKTIAKDATPDELQLFLEICSRKQLDPFSKDIYFIKSEKKLNIQVSIDGYRKLAERSGKYIGIEGPFWCGEDGKWTDVWLKQTPPAAAKVLVYRSDFEKPIVGVAKFSSYVQQSPTWNKMPDLMIGKVAESIALRRAFPSELGGLYTQEEMEQAQTREVLELPSEADKDYYRTLYFALKAKDPDEAELNSISIAEFRARIATMEKNIKKLSQQQQKEEGADNGNGEE